METIAQDGNTAKVESFFNAVFTSEDGKTDSQEGHDRLTLHNVNGEWLISETADLTAKE